MKRASTNSISSFRPCYSGVLQQLPAVHLYHDKVHDSMIHTKTPTTEIGGIPGITAAKHPDRPSN